MKKIKDLFISATNIFNNREVSLIAAASTFYAILCLIPLSLLLIRVLGLFLGDEQSAKVQIYNLINTLYPQGQSETILMFQKILDGALFQGGPLTYLNIFLLAWASLAFFNTVWRGISVIAENPKVNSIILRLKGLLVIGLTIVLFTLIFVIPTFLKFMTGVVKDNFIITSLKQHLPQTESILNFFLRLEEMGMNLLLHSNLIPFILFLIYFTLLYKWLFQKKITLKGSIFGSLFFVLGAIFGKFLGSLYFSFAKKGLLQNYGDYYTFIMAFLWIFFVMCCFYYGSCISLAWERINKAHKP